MAVTYSRVGLRDVIFWQLTADTASTLTYAAAAETETIDAIDLQIKHDNTDPDVLYANDDENDVLFTDSELTGSLEARELPLTLQAKLLGNLVDDNGVVIEVAGATPPYYAMAFKSAKRKGKDRYVWLLKGRAKPMSEEYGTKEGPKVNRQNDKIEFKFIKRTKDNLYEYEMNEEDAGVGVDIATKFFAEVYDGVLPV